MAANPLERFHTAQNAGESGFASALTELRTTGKRSHWIWYVFPQLAGLGGSSQSRRYGIRDREEAQDYLRDPVLRARLITATQAVAERLQAGLSLQALMGSSIDSLKLVSSLTLFEPVAKTLFQAEALDECAALADVAGQVLVAAEAQGFQRCSFTLQRLGS